MSKALWSIFLIASLAAAQSPVPSGATVELVAKGFQFVEGPVWSDSTGLLFSDIPGNTVYKWTAPGDVQVFLRPSANANGLAFDAQGRLILAQTGLRRVARREHSGTQTPLATLYNGKKLNSPNDLAVKSDGAIFFTDPPFNIPTGEKAELSFSGIYRISPAGTLQLLDSSLALPNGICFSPDESKLYVNNSQERVVYVWDVVNDSTIANKRRFAAIAPTGYADGMKVDAKGNLFCAAPLGVWVFGPDGAVLDTILVPGQTSNCNWGDTDGKTLYMTSGTSVYRIRLAVTGVEEHGALQLTGPELFANYPNPFNGISHFGFSLPSGSQGGGEYQSRITLKIYDMLGREVATVVDDTLEPGRYERAFEADGLSSGAYLYRLDAGGHASTRTMLLVR